MKVKYNRPLNLQDIIDQLKNYASYWQDRHY